MNHFQKKNLIKIISITFGLSMLCLLLGYLFLIRLKISVPCLFHAITGLSCPGCGNTRAFISLLNLEFKQAFRYNMALPLEIFYAGFVYVYCSIHYILTGKFRYTSKFLPLDITVLVLLILWWIIRNILEI